MARDVIYENIAANIAFYMQKKGIKTNELARRIGVTTRTIQNRQRNPKMYMVFELETIANILGVRVQDILLGSRPVWRETV